MTVIELKNQIGFHDLYAAPVVDASLRDPCWCMIELRWTDGEHNKDVALVWFDNHGQQAGYALWNPATDSGLQERIRAWSEESGFPTLPPMNRLANFVDRFAQMLDHVEKAKRYLGYPLQIGFEPDRMLTVTDLKPLTEKPKTDFDPAHLPAEWR